jgi:hypothetical protein
MITGLKNHNGYKYVENIPFLQTGATRNSNMSSQGLLKQIFNTSRYCNTEGLHLSYAASKINVIGGCIYNVTNNLMAIITVRENAVPYSSEHFYFADDLILFISDEFVKIGTELNPIEYFFKIYKDIEIIVVPQVEINNFVLDIPFELKRKGSKLLKDAMAEIAGGKVQQATIEFVDTMSNEPQWDINTEQRILRTTDNPESSANIFRMSVDPISAQEEPVEGDYSDGPMEF